MQNPSNTKTQHLHMWVGLRQCVNTFSGEKGHTDIDMIWYGMGHRGKKRKEHHQFTMLIPMY